MNLFFPSHDIALGNGVKHFNPPKAAQMLQEDLAWLEEIFNPNINLNPNINPNPNYSRPSREGWGGSISPWGWNWDTREYLHKEYKIARKDLPTDEQLEALRQLSNRRTTIEILKALNFKHQMPEYLTNEVEVDAYIERAEKEPFEYVMKTPWSSSGRGLIRSTVTPCESVRNRALSTIRKMGGIMAERWFDKKQDFAMLFFVGQDTVHPLGYSLFDNEESGTYRQGYLLTNEEIERRLTEGTDITIDQLKALQSRLISILNNLFSPFFGLPWQVGYIGIDMMVMNPNENQNENQNETIPNSSLLIPNSSSCIHPCVELNLRCTMGVVARLWSDRNLQPGQTGRFVISPMGEDGHFNAHFLID